MPHGDDTTKQLKTGEFAISAQELHELKKDIRDGFAEMKLRLSGIEGRQGGLEALAGIEKHKLAEALAQIADLEREIRARGKEWDTRFRDMREQQIARDAVEAAGRGEPHWAIRALVIAILNVLGGAGALWILHGLATTPIGVHP